MIQFFFSIIESDLDSGKYTFPVLIPGPAVAGFQLSSI